MHGMNKIDFHALDGQILRTFLAILEESSVSRAAERLDVTQSAVSHTLAKLRRILGDPLFVRSGQGLTPTETALALRTPVRQVLDGLKGLTHHRDFDPKSENMHFVIAANDLQRDLIFPQLLRTARDDGISVALEIKPSGVPTLGLLKDDQCDLILTPVPPVAPGVFQRKLFSGRMMCFFDPDHACAPQSVGDYLKAEHVSVQFALGGSSNDVLRATALPEPPNSTVTVPNFAGIKPFVLGTKMLATQIEFMQNTSLRGLAMAPLPFASDPVDIFMVWHVRSKNDPAHRWLRENVRRIASGIGRAADPVADLPLDAEMNIRPLNASEGDQA